ncbi:hypothetical protein BKA66DRAFT_424999, partial [Pyrenochaeta sp. MPI-SDFR-AT-0127]
MRAIASIRRSRTLRNIKVGTNTIKECWPNPQQSVGRFIAKIGNQSCWEAVGPARATFLGLAQDIKQYLDTYSEPTSTWITWSIYMIGNSPELAIPTIIFCCDDAAHRKAIRDTIRDSSILDAYSGIALKHLPRAPDYNQLVQLASPSTKEDIDILKSRTHSPYGPAILSISQNMTSGSPLYIRMSDHAGKFRKATAGSVIRIQGQDCLTTVAHAFNGSPERPSDPSQGGGDLYFSDSEDEYDAMSAASYSSDCSHISLVSEELTGRLDSASDSTGECSNHEFEDSAEEYTTLSPDPALLVGQTLFLATEGMQPDLDYALIRLDKDPSNVSADERVQTSKDLMLPCLTTAEDFIQLKETKVIADTASAGTLGGHISTTPVFLRIPNAEVYQEVYHVRLETPLTQGDCGSWVSNASTGSLHGHIVAGCPDTGAAYIVPAYQIFDDIQKNLETIKERL